VSTQEAERGGTNGPKEAVEVLSDTKGANIAPYMQAVLKRTRQKWYDYMPSSAPFALPRQGRVVVSFDIMRNGFIRGMKLEQSSNDPALDRAAWAAIATSNPLLPLPGDFSSSYLALRFTFYYNFEDAERSASPIPQGVRHQEIKVHITESSSVLRVPLGSSQLLTAAVSGTTNLALKWTVTGTGCSGTACGTVISGLYIAPGALPNPPMVVVRAISEADPDAQSYVRIQLVAAKDK
jgi:TonB family protein